MYAVPDTPTVATKTVRDSKESVPVASVPATNDSKLSHSQVQVIADSKTLQREISNESTEKEAENERRAPVVSINWIKAIEFDVRFDFIHLIFIIFFLFLN